MYRKIISTLFFCALIISCSFNIWHKKVISNNLSDLESLTNNINKAHWQNSYLTEILTDNFLNLGRKISEIKGFTMENIKNPDPIVLFDNQTNKEKLIFRFSSVGCSSCSSLFFDKLKVYLDKIEEKYDIYILVDFQKYSDFHNWKKASGLLSTKLQYFKVPITNLKLDLEQSSASYVFTLSKDNNVTSMFTPNNIYSDYIDLYLSCLAH